MSVKTFLAAMTLKVKIIVICSAVAVTSAAAIAVGVAVSKEDAYRVLKVFEMTGTAVVERDGSGMLDAYVGMNLESGDTLTVGDGSNLRISLDSDKYILLDCGTILELTATGTAADSRTSINLKQGTILNEITNPLSANSSYEVSTPKATMAVRGTSFTVSVDADAAGGYIIREDTFDGKVEVTLIDEQGNPRNDKAIVPADKGVTIRTEPDKASGNPAEIDGTSRFVFEDENGGISELEQGQEPIRDIRYNMISATVRNYALRSNDENLMILDGKIVAKLRGSSADTHKTDVTTAVTVSETEPTPAVTSVPETALSTEENTQTAAADTSYETSPTETPAASETASSEVNSDTLAAETSAEETISKESVSKESESSATSADTTAESSDTHKTETEVTTVPTTISVTNTTPYTGLTGTSAIVTTPTGTSATVTSATVTSATVTSITEPIDQLYNVNFICDGKLLYSEAVKSGKTVSDLPDIPEKTGYTAKWMSGGKEFTSATKVTSDMTVTAVYTIKSYTITLTSEADTSYSKTITADYGTLLVNVLPDVPEVTGYTGVWKIGGTVLVSGGITVTSDLSIKAVYTINTYTVTFKAEGSEDITTTVEYGSTIAAIPDIPEKTGYTAKWMSGGKEFTSATKVTSDMTVTAVYTIKSYTITLTSSADPAYSKTISADYGSLLVNVLPAVPKVTGYTGVWKIDGTVNISGSYKVTGNIAVKAVYTINSYTVTFTADADTPYSHEETVDYGTLLADILPELPAKTGHDGVWTIGGATIDADYIIEGDTKVVADYTPKKYTVTFLNADGSIYDTRKVEYNTTVTDIPEIQKDGYIVKWMYNGSEFTSEIVITDNIEVNADETEAVKLTFNFVTKDPEVYIIPKGTSLQDNGYELPEADAEKYHTGRWNAYITVDWPFDESVTFEPIQETITYYFKFYDTDGTTFLSPMYLTYVDQISTVAPDVNGVEADSWLIYSEDGSSSRKITDADTVAKLVDEFGFDDSSAIKVVAVMDERTLTWYDESGISHISPVMKGDNVREKLNSLHALLTGYFWAGADKATPIADDMTITADNTEAYAVPNEYTVTFLNEDGSEYTKTTAKHGMAVKEFPDVPEKSGSVGKWMYGDSEFTSETPVTGNISVKPEYFVTVKFMYNGNVYNVRSIQRLDTIVISVYSFIGENAPFATLDDAGDSNVKSYYFYDTSGTQYWCGNEITVYNDLTLTAYVEYNS